MTPTQSNTVWYQDKNLYVFFLSMIVPALSAKLGVQLSADKIAGLAVVAAAFIVTHGWKSAQILLKEIEVRAIGAVTADPAPSATSVTVTAQAGAVKT